MIYFRYSGVIQASTPPPTPAKRMSREEQSDLAGRSLVKRCQESQPALIYVIFSFLLHLSKVKSIGQKKGQARKRSIY